ncbi:MAG: hypothetical protein AAGF92_22270 [Myxococcota bacterium]
MNAPAIQRETPTLAVVQARIDATPYGRLTLDPNRAEATGLAELVDSLASTSERPRLAAAAAEVAEAQLENFPGNLFWDFDCFLATIHRHATLVGDYAQSLAHATKMTVTLMALYGQRSKIRFRYVHDFIYGFDWARWVRRDPDSRKATKPFEVAFLAQSESRGRDILRLIDADDDWYPQLKTDAPRNPFPFFREPGDELRLYRDLADHGLIPVPAWSATDDPVWDRDFDTARRSRAKALGLARR